MENCSFADINLRLDWRTWYTRAAIGTIWSRDGYRGRSFENVILSSGIRFSSSSPPPPLFRANRPLSRLALSFSSRRIAIMLILTMRFIASFRSGASMKRTRLRKNDGKSFRLRFTLLPPRLHSYPPISALRVYIPLSHSSAGIRSRSNVCTFGIRVLEAENVELHYTDGERVSSTQSCVFALTRRRGSLTTPVSGIKGAGY